MGILGVQILKQIPDIPKWIYVRWMILSGQGRIYRDDDSDLSSLIVQHPTNLLTCVLGKPEPQLIYETISAEDDHIRVIAFEENVDYVKRVLAGWEQSIAYLHMLSNEYKCEPVTDHSIRFLEKDELAQSTRIPVGLQSELNEAMLRTPVAAYFVNAQPVTFCYAAAETESWWDVSVDTLEEYRGKGYAGYTVKYLIEYMRSKGKNPVYGAEETNEASTKLARKLGFKPVDKLYLFNRR